MSDIVTIGLHRDTLRALLVLNAHTFTDGTPVRSRRIRDAALRALIFQLGANECEITIEEELGVNGNDITRDVLEAAGVDVIDDLLEAELRRCGL